MNYGSVKIYHPERGLSCCFRQWRAKHSHCQFLHGYSLGFKFTFEADRLDEQLWVYDFGQLDWLADWLKEMFDHTTLIAQDDPEILLFKKMHEQGIIDLRLLPAVSCEQFAKFVYDYAAPKIQQMTQQRVRLLSVEVLEHNANAAIYFV